MAASLPLSDYLLKHWTSSDGLPHNSINAIVQTEDGYLWLATWSGLVRYNGDRFEHFGRGEPTGLPSSAIRTIVPDPAGGMLVMSTRAGLTRYFDGQWQPQPPAPGVVKHQIRSRDGALWLAVEGKGVFRRVEGEADQLVIPRIVANRLLQDAAGTIWVAADQGLFRIDQGKATRVDALMGLPSVMVYEVLITADGRLLVGTEQGSWQLTGNRFVQILPRLGRESVSTMFEDSRHNLWLGTISGELYRYGERGLEHLGADQGMPRNRVMSIVEDREGSIWIGTNGGLIQLREAPFVTWTERRGLNGNYVRSVLGHSDGSIWVGSSAGLSRIVPGQDTAQRPLAAKLSVLSLAEGAEGELWIGGYDSGLSRWRDGALETVLDQQSGLGSNEVRAIVHDRQGVLWAGTPTGVLRLQPDGTVTRFGKARGLEDTFIIGLIEAPDGAIWAATSTGIARLGEDDDFHKVPLPVLPSDDYVYGMTILDQYLWLATERGQIRVHLESGKQQLISMADGLPMESCFQVVADNLQQLWLSCRMGIVKLTLADIEARFAGKAETIPYRLYSVGDGLLTSQTNGVSNPAATRDNQGRVWIATAKGVSVVNPDRQSRTVIPRIPLLIENVQVDQQPFDPEARVTLPAGASRLQLTYGALSYLNPEQIQFRTRLEGFDSHWTERLSQRQVEYTNLPPGRYQLKIQARYPQGRWQDNSITLEIIQQPFIWQRKGFVGLVVAALLGGLVLLYLLRMRQLQHREALLQSLVQQRTTELREQAEAFEQQARQDALTGLSNRRRFDEVFAERFTAARQQGSALALAIVDIDHFKQVNDQWSHMVGDEAICAVADLLRYNLPQSGFVARWGGEEFTLLMEGADARHAFQQCEKLRHLLATTTGLTSARIQLTASFGVADIHSAASYDQMLTQADMALCTAKEMGRNRVEIWQEAVSTAETPLAELEEC